MALSSGFLGNLIGRHLKHHVGQEGFNTVNGRGYVFSTDGRVGFFIDLNHAEGPQYAVSFSAALSDTEAQTRTATANSFVRGTGAFPTSDALTDQIKSSTTSLFYKAFDARIVDLSTSSLGSTLSEQGLSASDFSNTPMLIETWIDGILKNAVDSDAGPNSGVRGIIAGVGSPKTFQLWTENAMTSAGENAMLTDPTKLTQAQKNTVVDGKDGFDYLGLLFQPTSLGVVVNFSNISAQTLSHNNVVLNMKNFEGTDLTDFNDRFTGSVGDNTVTPSRGVDIIDGGGAWRTDGTSPDRDWVQYGNGSQGITVRTAADSEMRVNDYGGDVDVLTNVEAVAGTYFVDRFYGGSGNFNQIFSGLKGSDIIDGGVGRDDRVWHGDDPSGAVVNFSAKTVNTKAFTTVVDGLKTIGVDGALGPLLVIKEAIESLDSPKVSDVASNRALDGWGNLDILSNIEAATGSNFNDQLFGSNFRNILTGNDGVDLIVGNGGDDIINGGFGHDYLHGGLGRDWIVMDELNWGKLTLTGTNNTYNYSSRFVRDPDQSGNIVTYKSVNESTVQFSDVLDGFKVGDDLIDLTGIDANTKRSGNQEFKDTLVTSFTGKAGELKVSSFTGLADLHNFSVSNADGGYKLSGTELQGDINGDGRADFSIKLIGVAPNTLSDSILF